MEIGIVAGAIGCALSVAGSPHLNRTSLFRPPLRWIALWLAWTAGTALFAPTGPDTLLTVGVFVVLAGSVVCIHGESGEMGLAQTLLLAFACFVGLSVLVSVTDSSFELSTVGGRISLLALEANQLARAAGVAAIASLHILLTGLRRRSLFSVVVGAIGVLSGCGFIVLGQSRTGGAALVGAAAVFAMALVPYSKRLIIVTVGAAALVAVLGLGVVWAGGSDSFYEKFQSAASRHEIPEAQGRDIQSLNGRIGIWSEILTEAAREPVSGYGLGNDTEVITLLYADGRSAWRAEHTHSLFLQILLTTGVAGLILMGTALASIAARAFDANSPLGPALLVLVLVDGISEAVIREPSFGWFALVAAAAVVAKPLRTVAPPAPKQVRSAQLSEERTPVTSSSISSTALS